MYISEKKILYLFVFNVLLHPMIIFNIFVFHMKKMIVFVNGEALRNKHFGEQCELLYIQYGGIKMAMRDVGLHR